ncbi:P-loop containing nucleoside triphosphate hydrolase protein [Catenaria anguillulae PL171]|uniref:p-loop containing nucleoside triphosphate hydrolase protein n=1 Tax=Catenaria anguillulae PL171 TaxID=765915 RepID=A0A1Y2HYV7_9FUNG|nr:P-loop containing nucleoside triphosphate hydrolase protein [Catenaria anguillulae PL171]
MYVGESEANVRRVFQRAREAAPAVIFFDELDSLLAELDNMSGGGTGDKPVFVMGATNRPDLLDEALLRPGRFDKLVFLDVPRDHEAQRNVLKALTRKFPMSADKPVDLLRVAQRLPLSLTGADLYALASDAMLAALTRRIEARERGDEVDEDDMARPVEVVEEDFVEAASRLSPSVSKDELAHYRRLEAQFTASANPASATPEAPSSARTAVTSSSSNAASASAVDEDLDHGMQRAESGMPGSYSLDSQDGGLVDGQVIVLEGATASGSPAASSRSPRKGNKGKGKAKAR